MNVPHSYSGGERESFVCPQMNLSHRLMRDMKVSNEKRESRSYLSHVWERVGVRGK
jgi:hypothetical protein